MSGVETAIAGWTLLSLMIVFVLGAVTGYLMKR